MYSNYQSLLNIFSLDVLVDRKMWIHMRKLYAWMVQLYCQGSMLVQEFLHILEIIHWYQIGMSVRVSSVGVLKKVEP